MVRLASVNVNGLEKHQDKVIDFVKNNNIDVLCLQEIHLTDKKCIDQIEKAVKGVLFYNEAQWSGTGIILRNFFTNLRIEHLKIDNIVLVSRITHLRIHSDIDIDIVSVYANSDSKYKPNFYENFRKYIAKYKNYNLIIAGDFNFVENKCDRSPNMLPMDYNICKKFNPLDFDLYDIHNILQTNVTYTHKKSRIDRIYTSDTMLNKVNKIEYLEKIADHRIILLTLDLINFEPWGKYYWKLNNSILQDNQYTYEINQILENFYDSNNFSDVITKWEKCKMDIKNTTIKISKIIAKSKMKEKEIGEEMLLKNFSQLIISNIEDNLESLKNYKNNGKIVRTKSQYLNDIYDKGREISRKEEIKKGQQKCIFKLNDNNNILTEKDQILNKINTFYTDLYTSQNIPNQCIDKYLENFNPPKLKKADFDFLDDYISSDEVKIAINDLNNNKSPGEDGLTAEFYKKNSQTIAPILADVFNDIFMKETLPKSMCNSIITLIFKKKGSPLNLKSWRPISLLNLDYKILAKLLANRIKSTLNDIIDPFQSSGCKNRNIINNALNLNSILSYAKQNNKPVSLISLDNEKAFDRVERNFILKTLQKFNFPPNFIQWFNIIYFYTTSKILVNGTFTNPVQITRGVRQGCPLSMLLYILSLEPLLFKVNFNIFIKGISIPNIKKEIKIIAHADDTTAILTTALSYKYLQQENNNYSIVSGSKINSDKTEIFNPDNIEGLPTKDQKDTIKIFGYYFGKNAIQLSFNESFNKMQNTIFKWENAKLNLFNKVIVIKTFIISQLQYFLKLYPINHYNLTRFNNLIFTFLWSSIYEKISRKLIMRNILDGGLSMPDIQLRSYINQIQILSKISQEINQPWSALYIYWLGFSLKDIYPMLSSNIYVHTMNIPKELSYYNKILKLFKPNKEIWSMNNKLIYKHILHVNKIKSPIEINLPKVNWEYIWISLNNLNNPIDKNIIFRYIHSILPDGEYLMKYHILQNLPKCTMCHKGFYTLNHIFVKCNNFKQDRLEFKKNIRQINPLYIFNQIFISVVKIQIFFFQNPNLYKLQ